MEQALIKHCKETLKKNNLEPIKKLGKGGFGIVFLVSKSSYESQLYSVKCTSKKQFIKKPLLRRYLKQEIALMEGLEHENIVKLIRTFEDDGWIFMVMEYCDLGNISSIQTQKKQGVFPYQQCCFIIQEVVSGLSYMHENDVLHRDIKPENILRKKNKKGIVTKICDLGFSRQAKQQVNTFCGTTYYMAPQIFQKKQYDWKIDVWALGVLMYTMLFGCVPFKGINMENEIKNKCEHGFDLMKRKVKQNSSISKDIMKRLSELFKGVFEINPEKRWDLIRIVKFVSNKQVILYQPERKILQKLKTIDTDNTDNNSSAEQSPKSSSFEMEEVWFIQHVLDGVSQIQFLDCMQFLALKYYLDKVSLSILNIKESKKKPMREKNMIDKLKESQKRDSHLLADNLGNCGIPKLKEAYSSKASTSFQDYKEQYRLVVGHAFYKAHKCVKDYELKMQTKLKLFCCHVINRVFEQEYRKDLFSHYYRWLSKKSKSETFELRQFCKWIKEDKIQNIIDTVEIINNKFYRKPVH